MKIGYGRVSTLNQNPNLQRDTLEVAGYEQVIINQRSGTVAKQPPSILRNL
ncbi:resolvase domain-containing protein [Nitrosococcus watsonii]|uniref:Resolvase domain protein n=1 Tax=Nitrosococcus watsoni (strain C-113) TaxID=105559 RepID=D8K9B2_NITWC|nr:resolvase domain-containing protein [Nitrosococcus watsonii]ADJ29255.1 Resolvase domain protein [Nitrosococcus watsonii C-113]